MLGRARSRGRWGVVAALALALLGVLVAPRGRRSASGAPRAGEVARERLRVEAPPRARAEPPAGRERSVVRVPADDRAETVPVPIRGYRPEPGSVDPGPGPYLELYEGRSGQLSPHARVDGGEVTTRVRSPGPWPRLEVWVPSVRVPAAAEVVIHARLTDPEGVAVVPEAVAVYVLPGGAERGAELGAGGVSGAMAPAAPGAGHHFEHRFRAEPAPAGEGAPRAVDYAVRATGTFRGERFERVAVGGFRVHAPGATLDPASARVERDAGDLRVTARVRVHRAGRFGAYAELWGGAAGGRPIAFARERFGHLDAGEHPVSLRFGGLLVRDAEVDGPYVVRNLRFVQADSVPPHEQEPVPALAPTEPWRARDFY